jgi:hypothetical protein
MSSKNIVRSNSGYILAYLLWFICIALGLLVVWQARDAGLSLLIIGSINPTQVNASEQFYATLQMRAADIWSLFVIGFILIVFIVFLEYYFRISVPEGHLWSRFTLVMGLEFGFLFLASLTKTSVAWLVTPFSWQSLSLPLIEILLTGFFGGLWLFFKRRSL